MIKDFQTVSVVFMSFGIWNSCWMPAEIVLSTALFFPITAIPTIALDSGNKITQSIPLGHLGNFDSMFTPQRFVEQIVAFEYLFDKLEHKKAQNLQFPLKKELEYMFNEYPQLLSQTNLSAEKVSNQIKEIRRTIAHGYAYYYDFKNDRSSKYLMILLDKLIRCMSLKLIGFSNDDISNFMPFYP